MQKEITYKQFYRYVAKYYPEIAASYPGTRREMTKDLMSKTFALFCHEKNIQGSIKDNDTKRLFIIVALLIFDPAHITCSSGKMRMRLRPMLSDVLDLSGNLVSYYTKKAISEYGVYKDFQDEALSLAKSIFAELYK